MKLAESDLEQSYFQSIRTGNDKIVAYLFVGIAILTFCSLFLLGVNRAQSVTEHPLRDGPRPALEVNQEIGDVVDSSNK